MPPLPLGRGEAATLRAWLAMLCASDARPHPSPDRSRRTLAGATRHVADVSHGRTVFAIAGPGAIGLLAHGCSLDLHPRVFAPGRCAQTLFAQVPALLHLRSAEPRFDLHVDASHEAHLRHWFAQLPVAIG